MNPYSNLKLRLLNQGFMTVYYKLWKLIHERFYKQQVYIFYDSNLMVLITHTNHFIKIRISDFTCTLHYVKVYIIDNKS